MINFDIFVNLFLFTLLSYNHFFLNLFLNILMPHENGPEWCKGGQLQQVDAAADKMMAMSSW